MEVLSERPFLHLKFGDESTEVPVGMILAVVVDSGVDGPVP